ncbi:S26 family signal peptidase [Nocardia nepalensis]|uniref:S26 family signal peptidase n=1 Tax=Nocardia nepalensis TaxID=3375448 RepID=UPI003B67524C
MTIHGPLLAATVAVASTGALLAWARRHLLLVTVQGPSMQPTLHNGDQLIVLRNPRRLHSGDIIVLEPRSPHRPLTQPRWLIKRLIALPGDLVPAHLFSTLPNETTVPPGHFIVLGDNPDRSYDSRQHGYFTTTSILGTVIYPRHSNKTQP